jgi:hypothetical protein
MDRYVIKKSITIEANENDHFSIPFIVDPLIDLSSEFTFALYHKRSELVRKSPAIIDNVDRKISFHFVPSDTYGKGGLDIIYELQMKTLSGHYHTIAQGNFKLYKTLITNE